MTGIAQIQAAADRCTAQRGADRTAQIIDDAAALGFSDAQLITALDAGTTAAARPWYDAPSVQSLIRAARLTDAERALLDARLHAPRLCITTPAELRAFLQELARARVAARCEKLAPLPASELADVAHLAGELARAQRAADVAEANHAHHTGATILQAPVVKVVVAGDVAYVDSATRQGVTYRVDLEDGVPRSCTCRDGRALVGICKHARAAYECARQGDGTYEGTLSPLPRPQRQTSPAPRLQPRAQRALAVMR